MPSDTRLTRIPDTVQTLVVVLAKVTDSWEVAEADNPMPSPVKSDGFFAPGLGKSIVCSPFNTANDLVTSAAIRYVASPGCDAVIVQVPGATNTTSLPLTVQTVLLEA